MNKIYEELNKVSIASKALNINLLYDESPASLSLVGATKKGEFLALPFSAIKCKKI